MMEIKDSIKKIRAASVALEQNMQEPQHTEQYIKSLHRVLTEINSNVEELKQGVVSELNSPLQLKRK